MSNALNRDLVKLVLLAESHAAEAGHGRYAQRFHVMPPCGWLNDPNGLCQKDGTFHTYFQYAPFDVDGGVKCWGHVESEDLLHWRYTGAPLLPDEPFDCHGVYSGSAVVADGKIRALYTGNVKLADPDGVFDYVNTGRRADTVLVESGDGRSFGPKRVVLGSEDYPADLTCHVRDPQVWRDGTGRFHMVLGARRRVEGPHVESRFCVMHGEGAGRDAGEVLVWGSDDMLSWQLERRVSADERFGFMWECPSYLELAGAGEDASVHHFLSFSPQGLEGGRWDRGNVYAAGYLPVAGDITDAASPLELGEFRLWDSGFDFYAPQVFCAEDGRRILIGWMGMPDEPSYGNDPTVADGWQHCLTVPRELSVAPDGGILQAPVRELEACRGAAMTDEGSCAVGLGPCFDVTVEGIDASRGFSATIDSALQISLVPADDGLPRRLELRFADTSRTAPGCGRGVRWEPVSDLSSVRIVADVSSVEIFANGGALVMSTRIYPEEYGACIEAPGAFISCYPLEM